MINPKFNKDLDTYVAKRKDSKNTEQGIKFNISLPRKAEKVPELDSKKVHILYKKPSLWQRMFGPEKKEDEFANEDVEIDPITGMRKELEKNDKEMQEIHEEEEKLEEKRENIFKRILRSLKIIEEEKEESEDIPIAEEPALDSETVETIKLMGKWLNKLDNDIKKDFRDSGDYAKYKSFIDKYGLGKKK